MTGTLANSSQDRADHAEGFREQDDPPQRTRRPPAGPYPDVDAPQLDLALDRAGIHVPHLDHHVRAVMNEGLHHVRQDRRRHRGNRADPYDTAAGLRHLHDGIDAAVELRRPGTGLGQDQLTQCGKTVLAVAFEQRRPQMIRQLLERHGHRRGRTPQPVRGIIQVAMLGDGDKTAKHFDLDGHRASTILKFGSDN
jgi:hypothetical protein